MGNQLSIQGDVTGSNYIILSLVKFVFCDWPSMLAAILQIGKLLCGSHCLNAHPRLFKHHKCSLIQNSWRSLALYCHLCLSLLSDHYLKAEFDAMH